MAPQSALETQAEEKASLTEWSLYPYPLTSHQTSVFGHSSVPAHKLSQTAFHFLEVLQKPSPVKDMTMTIAFMGRLVGYGPVKGMLLLSRLDISQRMGKYFYFSTLKSFLS